MLTLLRSTARTDCGPSRRVPGSARIRSRLSGMEARRHTVGLEHARGCDIAENYLREQQEPLLATFASQYEMFSQLQNTSRVKRDPRQVAAEEATIQQHSKSSIKFYRKQMDAGRLFLLLHECISRFLVIETFQ